MPSGCWSTCPRTPSPSRWSSISTRYRDLLEHQWTAPLATAAVGYSVELRYGPPVQVLLQTAEDENADLIVVGTRGASGAMHIRLGSTSSQLTEQSTRPVAVIPMPARSR